MNLFEKYDNKNSMIKEHFASQAPLSSIQKMEMTKMLANSLQTQERILSEGTVSQDIATFTQILAPLIRQMYPRLIASQLLGVQPMSGPTGFVYSLVSRYNAKDRDEQTKLVIYKLENHTLVKGTRNVDGEVIVYTEGDYVLATINNGLKKVGETLGGFNILEVYSGSTAMPRILKNYSEADARDETRPDINNIGLEIQRKPVEVKERTLRGRYSLEMYQDMKSQHGLVADLELMELISAEVQADIDADVINFVNSNAKILPDLDVSSFGVVRSTDIARELAFTIAHQASDIARTTNRGIANILLCSPRVANLLASLDKFDRGALPNDLSKVGVWTGDVGTLDGRMKVLVDPYAIDDYITVLYRGTDNRDSMGFFCPYAPLVFSKTIDAQTGNNVLFGQTRYALTTVPGIWTPQSNDRAQLYARSFNVTGLV